READTRSRTARLAGGAVAANKSERPERSDPAVIRSIHLQELAAPDRAIITVARAVPRNPQRGAVLAVLGKAGHDVGVMMLDNKTGQSPFLRVARREVVGMGVVHDSCGLNSEQPGQVGNVFDIAPARTGRVEIADVLPQEELAAPGECN